MFFFGGVFITLPEASGSQYLRIWVPQARDWECGLANED
jgi:hypothetical protein